MCEVSWALLRPRSGGATGGVREHGLPLRTRMPESCPDENLQSNGKEVIQLFRGKDLSDTCGIPFEGERIYVEVECRLRGLNDDVNVSKRLIWPDGRSWPIRSTARHVTHGRAVFGNPVERFDVFMGHSDEVRTLWRQDGRWFVSKTRDCTTRPPRTASDSHG